MSHCFLLYPGAEPPRLFGAGPARSAKEGLSIVGARPLLRGRWALLWEMLPTTRWSLGSAMPIFASTVCTLIAELGPQPPANVARPARDRGDHELGNETAQKEDDEAKRIGMRPIEALERPSSVVADLRRIH